MSQTHGLFLVEEAWASGSRRGANGPQAGVSGQAGRVARNRDGAVPPRAGGFGRLRALCYDPLSPHCRLGTGSACPHHEPDPRLVQDPPPGPPPGASVMAQGTIHLLMTPEMPLVPRGAASFDLQMFTQDKGFCHSTFQDACSNFPR